MSGGDWPLVPRIRLADRPDEVRRLMRTYAEVVAEGTADDMALRFAAASLAEHWLAVDDWLTSGGELPRLWQRDERKPYDESETT